ncbi:type VI secretion system baseplate subunit TssE [Ketobacter sp. MCCC 1A13808]|uniref:type VI secretion system baseplate subunit TssE n=1 Tax=Ketobacter sp. MCCC 1A13808 TaxID=2602738 RepID=UPI000F2DC66E|nr:type VI secretion system baseplate subunit TssE [Ketobacter sp. MCCC 1A13808]MVF10929.1 type VI secretion system baseplate subunit TssE [Ketobacter sp. MCCC 1A13808]RLP56321.1 MAG: type VI secretion system baseplate subunit TssE [Ketobacter sp.]|tara:strand:+ start:34 stop:450 length:417 start_codon:yes stop_codon:yes gene_type:complete
MRNEFSLLDRLDNNVTRAGYSTTFNWNAYLESVTTNVQNMLNVRQGSVKALPEFGMPDFNDIVAQFPDAVTHIRFAIQQFLEQYEPRLEGVSVYYIPDADNPLTMKYGIEGTLRYGELRSRVAFDTVLTGTGQATVRL